MVDLWFRGKSRVEEGVASLVEQCCCTRLHPAKFQAHTICVDF